MRKILLLFVVMVLALLSPTFAGNGVDTLKLKKTDSTAYSKLDANQIFELEMAKHEPHREEPWQKAPFIMFIPFFTAICIILFFLLYRYLNNRKKYEIFLKYAESGRDIPLELLEPKKEEKSNLKRGLLNLSLGLGLMLFLYLLNPGRNIWSVGFILIFVGIGYLLVNWLENKSSGNDEPTR